ncbi:DUF2846 domain-containing protein [Alishewanella sp. HL-SH05]|uniref:DUF2846 domain-containing protein n=1 Tax=Alishewanella sp. HL-SH05 TaxID=3461145 RepID=UPI004040FE8C
MYVHRKGSLGGALKKDVWINGECIGETAPDIFFYKEVDADREHQIATESEFSPNTLTLKTESGKNYYVLQFIRPGMFVGGAGLKMVDEARG